MEPKIFIGIIALCALVLFVIFGAIAYSIHAVFSIGARSEPQKPYYLIIHKEKHIRKDRSNDKHT